jgi:hypothetical protein
MIIIGIQENTIDSGSTSLIIAKIGQRIKNPDTGKVIKNIRDNGAVGGLPGLHHLSRNGARMPGIKAVRS